MTASRRWSPAAPLGGVVVAAVVVGGAAAVAWIVGPQSPERARAIAAAAAVCLVGAAGAAAATALPATTAAGRAAYPLVGLGLRLGPALVALAWLQAGESPLREAGAAALLAIFYLAALAADVGRIIIWGRDSERRPRDSRPN